MYKHGNNEKNQRLKYIKILTGGKEVHKRHEEAE